MYSIGLDISKSTINVYIPHNDSDLVIENNLKSLRALYSKLKKYYKKDIDKLIFVYEPTSTYSFLLMKFCSDKSIKSFIVNPKQSSNFSKVIGQRNKNDISDARMLSKMIVTAEKEQIKVPHVDTIVEELKELITYYKLLLKQERQSKNHLEAVSSKNCSSIVIKTIKESIKNIKSKQNKLILELKRIINSKEELKNKYQNLQTIKGIGELSAIVLLHHFLKYPNANQKEIVSLAGLEPIQRVSGSSINHKSKISKSGSKLCRSTLFMASIVAINYNEEMKIFYDRLKKNGKHTTVAQVAVMRKLIVIAHSLYKNNNIYDEKKYLNH